MCTYPRIRNAYDVCVCIGDVNFVRVPRPFGSNLFKDSTPMSDKTRIFYYHTPPIKTSFFVPRYCSDLTVINSLS